MTNKVKEKAALARGFEVPFSPESEGGSIEKLGFAIAFKPITDLRSRPTLLAHNLVTPPVVTRTVIVRTPINTIPDIPASASAAAT